MQISDCVSDYYQLEKSSSFTVFDGMNMCFSPINVKSMHVYSINTSKNENK